MQEYPKQNRDNKYILGASLTYVKLVIFNLILGLLLLEFVPKITSFFDKSEFLMLILVWLGQLKVSRRKEPQIK